MPRLWYLDQSPTASPSMIRKHCEENLKRLQNELETYASANGISGGDPAAAKISKGIPLAHSTSDWNFVKICGSGCLYSPQALSGKGLKPLKSGAVELQLGTSGHVFFYAASFSFPGSGCGLLFGSSLERDNEHDGSATPFDSGGLVCPSPLARS
jgi:hypothetical protein